MTNVATSASGNLSEPARPQSLPLLTGAYVDLAELLRLRYSNMGSKLRRHQANANQNGTRLSKARGRGVDFAEVRSYQPGDDIRTIDWRVTARKNSPHTKVFREEKERPTLVVIDQTHTMFFGSQLRLKSVAAAHAGAIAAWNALAQNDRVGGFVMNLSRGSLHPPKHSATAVARLLNAVAEDNAALNRSCYRPSVDQLASQLRSVRRNVRSNYRIYIISDFLPSADFWHDSLRSLAQQNDVTALRIYDPLERELPADNYYTVTDGTEQQRFDGNNPELRTQYQQRFDGWSQDLQQALTSCGVRYATLATNDPNLNTQTWL